MQHSNQSSNNADSDNTASEPQPNNVTPFPKRTSVADIVIPTSPTSDLAPPDPPGIVTEDKEKEEKAAKGEECGVPVSAPLAPLPVSPLSPPQPAEVEPRPEATLPEDDDVFTAAPRTNPVIRAFRDAGLYVRRGAKRQHVVTCPWANEHGEDESGDAIYIEPTPRRPLGGYVCPLSHAEPPRIDRLFDRLSVSKSEARCKPRIRIVAGEMVRIVDRAESVLNAFGSYYQSGGAIVTIKQAPDGDAASVPITEHALLKALALTCDWEKYDGSAKAWRRCDPTPQVAKQLISAQMYDHLPPLGHIARQPYFRESDGVLITEPGYDPVSRTYAVFHGEAYPAVPSSQAAAVAALAELKGLLAEFQFASPVDCSATLCAILTAAARSSLPLAPAFNVTASTPGSGKSYLGNLLAAFAGPGEPLNLSYPTTSEEATKAMLAALIGKPAVISFDDMQTDWLPHGMINRMLTSETVADRLLGSNSTKQVGTKTFVMGTGNNVAPVRDMCRRVVTIALRPQAAAPATLRYRLDPVGQVKRERERHVALALTVISAWREAGSPRSDVDSIATFSAWSEMCRQPLLWLGEPDPATSLIEQVRHDPDAETFGRMIVAWYALFGSKPTTLRKVVGRAANDANLHDAIMDLPVVDRNIISHHKFGWFLKKNANRIVNGMYVQKEASSERNAWSVQYADPSAARHPSRPSDVHEIDVGPNALLTGKSGDVRLTNPRACAPGEIFD